MLRHGFGGGTSGKQQRYNEQLFHAQQYRKKEFQLQLYVDKEENHGKRDTSESDKYSASATVRVVVTVGGVEIQVEIIIKQLHIKLFICADSWLAVSLAFPSRTVAVSSSRRT